jgi:RNA polymerase sigma-70 factor (ECF subfamily)
VSLAAGASPLVKSFLARWAGTPPADDQELHRLLTALHERGRAAWPTVAIDPLDFAAFVGERAASDVEARLAVERLRAEDLYLVCGCARRQPGAMAAFDAHLFARVPVFVARLRLSESVLDELRQILRHRLFVSEHDRPAKILTYKGAGALEGWMRIAATRAALNLIAAEKANASIEDEAENVSQMLAPGEDPELDWMKAQYRDAVVRALRQSFQQLSHRDRNLLRFQFLDRLTPARIGNIYGVHRTTAMRWLAEAQDAMLRYTRQLLGDELGISPAECDSVLGLVRSRIDVTLRSLFRSHAS